MSHIRDHCSLPGVWFHRPGSVYACSCGRLYRCDYFQFGKGWEEITPTTTDGETT